MQLGERIYANADRPHYLRKINLYFSLFRLDNPTKIREYQLIPKDELTDSGIFIDPTIQITFEEAQTLMDDLYRCGIRPSDTIGSAGEKDALKNHLNDTRELLKNSNELVIKLIDKAVNNGAK